LEGFCIALPKPREKAIPSLVYSIKPWAELFWFRLSNGYYSCPKLFNALAIIPFLRYPKNPLGSITYNLKLGKVLHNLAKT
jgi:hypothetical protein